MHTVSEQVDPFLQPIAGSDPAGADLRYSDEYEAIRAEVAKLDSARGERVDWKKVVEMTQPLLQTQTKDMLLASYAVAAWAGDGPDGFERGLALWSGLLDRFGEQVYPRRSKAQAKAAIWTAEYLNQAAASLRVPAEQGERLQDLALRCGTSAARFGEDVELAFRDLGSGIKRQTVKATAKPAEAAAAPAAPQPGAAPAVVQAPTAPTSGDTFDVDKVMKDTGQQLVKLASALRKSHPSDLRVYRAMRDGLLLRIASAPPANDKGLTQLVPPTADLTSRLDQMYTSECWDALLDEAESSIERHRFWLDLHRVSWTALCGLGYEDCAEEVRLGASRMLQAFPELAGYAFSDGTPLVSPEARAWLQQGAVVQEAPESLPAVSELDAELRESVSRHRGEKEFPEAMRLLSLAAAGSVGRKRFVLQLEIANTLRIAGQVRAAQGVLEALRVESEERGLDAWDPALSSKFLRTYLKTSCPGAQLAKSLADKLLCRLAQCDPEAALTFEPTQLT